MDIGKRIRARRKQIRMSAETLASIIGVSPTTVYRYENGDIESVDSRKLEPIAMALKTSPAYLMGWETEDKEDSLQKGYSLEPPRSNDWRRLSEGLAELEVKDSKGFQATINFLTTMYPDIFTERNDDDDPES